MWLKICCFVKNPVVSLRFEFERKRPVAGSHNLAIREHVYMVGLDVVK